MNEISRIDTSTAVSTGAENYFAAYGEAQTQRTIVGDLLKFSKGEWTYGQHGIELDEGTQLVANMDELLIGWIKWEGGAPVEHIMGKVVDGYRPPKRKELGDEDPRAWETDNQGRPRDPWQFSNYLLLKEGDGDKLFTFTTSSRGGLNAIGELCKVYGKEMRARPAEYPVVALKVDSYRHKIKEYGKIFTPVLAVVGWAPKADFVAPLAAATQEDGVDLGDTFDQDVAPSNSRSGTKAAPANAPRF